MSAYEIEHITRGPYVVETVIRWHGIETQGSVPDVDEALRTFEDSPEIADLEHELDEARDTITELREEVDDLTAEVAPHREVCGMCQPGHPTDDHGLCRRHGLRVPALKKAARRGGK